jgi:WD40 repeat protein
VQSVALSADGCWLSVATGNDNAVLVWNLRSQPPALQSLAGHAKPVCCVALSADGRWLVSGSYDKTVRVWDLHADDPARQARVLAGFVARLINGLALSADGRWLAVSCDMTERVFDLQAAVPVETFFADHVSLTTCLAMSPDGRWLAAGGMERLARVWDLHAPDPAAAVRVLKGHESNVEDLDISSDGRWVVTAGLDRTVRLWDLHSRDPAADVQVLRGQHATVRLALGPEGRWLIAADAAHSTRAWLLDPLDLTAAASILSGVRPDAAQSSQTVRPGLPPVLEKLVRP